MGEFVKLEVADGIGTILLNRPPINALNDQLTASWRTPPGWPRSRTRSAR